MYVGKRAGKKKALTPETLVWENPKQRPNHFWDCEIMAQVGVGLRNKRPPQKSTDSERLQQRPKTIPQPQRSLECSGSAVRHEEKVMSKEKEAKEEMLNW